ncbi:protein MLN51 homolog isoform X2 [Silene latifolia]|uniref:protein MLN51 homolog isoform X2 n=1 Tax=Silene latifolia TaxID=37657 RepID=UPI003D785EB3
MAGEEDNTDYESDPDEVKMSLKMRRREASDDEEHDDDVEEINDDILHRTIGAVDSGGESDGQGAADDYEYEEEYYDDEYDEDSEVEEREINGGKMVEETVLAKEVSEVEVKVKEEEEEEKEKVEVAEVEAEAAGDEAAEKVVVEPFAVPTSGAFYMHDDRFRDMADGRNRRTFGGKKLWESKDERKWGHDKFEELHVQDRRYEEGKRSFKGPYRGRGKARGASSGNGRGNRVKQFSENSYQNAAPKDVRGRGPRKYQPVMKNNGETTRPPQYQQSARSFDKSSRTGSGRMVTSTGSSNVEYEVAPAKKVGSNLSSESPPFYPSGASTTDVASTQKKEMHSGNYNRNIRPSADPNFPTPVSNPLSRGKSVVNSKGFDRLHIDDSAPASSKTPKNMDLRYSSSSQMDSNQSSHHRGQGRVVAPSKSAVFQPRQTNNQVNRLSPQASEANKLTPVQTQGQSPLQTPGQKLVQRPLVTSQSSSPPKAGKGAVQGTGRGSVVYSGAQVMGPDGNVGAGHGDSNIPAFFPVMQFGGQHPDRMASVGMAFPGYVPPNGLGNSEMTWLPMLASAAGALGATYCPPYLAIDGNYHPRPTGQTSALPAPSKDNIMAIPGDEMKFQHTSEVANDELSHRQNKPRRYSEMNFRQ